MSFKEASPKSIKLKKETTKQDVKHSFSSEIERKAKYVDNRMSEYFKVHGIPNPAEFTAITRTLTAVFSGDYSNENSRNKSPKKLRPKK